jgi:hypothetical protein
MGVVFFIYRFAAVALLSSNLGQLKHNIFGNFDVSQQSYLHLKIAMIGMLMVSCLSQIAIMILQYKMVSLN